MREIKYNAWIKESKKMIDVSFINIPARTILESKGSYKHEGHCFEDVELLQYIGLNDKDGKEIYEGDIVKDDFGRIMVVFFNEEKAKFQFKLIRVEGEHSHWANNFVVADMTDWFERNHNHTQVIGNIYQNKNILEG
jgi:uncharacterized phage protein (TIGR01671 family)